MKKLLLSSLLVCFALINNVIAQSGANQTVLPSSYRMAMGHDSEIYENEQYIVLEDGSIGVSGALYKNNGIDIEEITLPGSFRMAQDHEMKVYGSDLYAVLEDGSSGIRGALHKYDGTAFTQINLPGSLSMARGYDMEVYNDDLYLVMEDGFSGIRGALHRYDGTSFTQIVLPGSLRMAEGYNMVMHDNDLYVVLEDGFSGIYGALYKYDGTSFSQIILPGSLRMAQDHDLEVYNNNLYLILEDGFSGIYGALYRYDSTSFSQIALPGSLRMAQENDLKVYNNELYLVLEDGSNGIRGALHKYDGTTFTQIILPGSLRMARDYDMSVFNCKLYFVLEDGSNGVYGALYEFDGVLPTVITQDLIVELDTNGEATITAAQINNGSTDNCGDVTIGLDITSFNSSNLGENTVTLTVTDTSGNEASATAIVSVQNNEAPSITCPEDTTTTATSPIVNFDNPTVTDNVSSSFQYVSPGMTYVGSNGGKNFFISDQSFSGANAFADAEARGGFVATINDAAQNVFIANALSANGISEAHIGYSDAASEGNFVWQDGSTSTYENWLPGEPNNTDGGEDYVTINAGGGWNDVGARGTGNARYILQLEQTDGVLIQTSGLASGSSFPIGITTNTFEAFDANGNSSSCSFDVTVTDTPNVITQNLSIDLDEFGTATITTADIDNGSSAVTGISDLSIDISTFNCSNLGENTVTLTVTSNSGETASETAILTVNDPIAPTVMTQDITVELDTNGEASITSSQIDNGSSDNCSSTMGYCIEGMNYGDTEIFIEGAASGRVGFSAGRVSASSGGVPMELVPITTVDSKVRSGDIVHAKSTLSNGSRPSGESIFYRNSDGAITWGGHSSSGPFANRTRLIIEQENVAAGELIDFSKPYNLRFQLNGRYLSQAGSLFSSTTSPADISAVLISGDLGATNNCLLTTSLNATSFDCSNIGENEVTLTVTDASGNEASATATVTVEDNLSPSVVTQDLTVELDANGEVTISAAQIDNGSADNCGVDNLALNITTLDCSNLGENTVTLTVTDASGNEASATAIVTVEDNVAPIVITQDITVDLAGLESATITSGQVNNGSTDNCTADSDLIFSLSQDTFTEAGTYTVSLTAEDALGNSSSANLTVTVTDSTLSTDEFSSSVSVNFYPNPAQQLLNIEANRVEIGKVIVFTITGSKALEGYGSKLNVSTLSSGVYLAKIESREGKPLKVIKFIKK